MDLIFFGRQGAGKGTLGKEIAKNLNFKVFETGGELRKLATEDSPLGKKIKQITEAGILVSNDIVMELVENFIKTISTESQIIFDGIPRSVLQAKTLNALLNKKNRKYKAILIEISEETALNRLTTRKICSKCKHIYAKGYTKKTCNQTINGAICGGELIVRKDDNPEAIIKRLATFKKETVPAIETYKNNMLTINGEPSIEEVYKDAETQIKLILK